MLEFNRRIYNDGIQSKGLSNDGIQLNDYLMMGYNWRIIKWWDTIEGLYNDGIQLSDYKMIGCDVLKELICPYAVMRSRPKCSTTKSW